ncbi:hypothetical protein BLNAU_21445 [Blattamonas nauphoetae]|uniref:E3 ubiquitin-protein ligase n=1 Tax=Blattamonas nauphoetae TaxID=2049346 RepID=A0ABQ9WVX2_9EUKA|nr:hypothetical protein BLNAU_21445 [Blattamonas nauphoetae]
MIRNQLAEVFCLQTCVCAAGWKAFLPFFLSQMMLDFFFLPPWFWKKNAQLCSLDSDGHPLPNGQDAPFPLPSRVDRIGDNWDQRDDNQLFYVSRCLDLLCHIIVNRTYHLGDSTALQNEREGILPKPDDWHRESTDRIVSLPLTDDALRSIIALILANKDYPRSEFQRIMPMSVLTHDHFEAIISELTVQKTENQQTVFGLTSKAWDYVDVHALQLLYHHRRQTPQRIEAELTLRELDLYDPRKDGTAEFTQWLLSDATCPDGGRPPPVNNSVSPSHPGMPLPLPSSPFYVRLLDVCTTRTALGMVWTSLHLLTHRQVEFDTLHPIDTEGFSSRAEKFSFETGQVPSNIQSIAYHKHSLEGLHSVIRLLDFTLCCSPQWVIEKGRKLTQPVLEDDSEYPLALPCPPNASFIEALFFETDCSCISKDASKHNTSQSIASLLFTLYSMSADVSLPQVTKVLVSRLLIRLRFLVNTFYSSDPRHNTWLVQIGVTEEEEVEPPSTDDEAEKKRKIKERQEAMTALIKQQQSAFLSSYSFDTASDDEKSESDEHKDAPNPEHILRESTGQTCLLCHSQILKGEPAGLVASIDHEAFLQSLHTSAVQKERMKWVQRSLKEKLSAKQPSSTVKFQKWWDIEEETCDENDLVDPQLLTPTPSPNVVQQSPPASPTPITPSQSPQLNAPNLQMRRVPFETALRLNIQPRTDEFFFGYSPDKRDKPTRHSNISLPIEKNQGVAGLLFNPTEGNLVKSRQMKDTLRRVKVEEERPRPSDAEENMLSWLDDEIQVETSDIKQWGDVPSNHRFFSDIPFMPHPIVSAPAFPYSSEAPSDATTLTSVKKNVYVQSCGHAMHTTCYVEMLRQQSNESPQLDHANLEYTCPGCRKRGNTLIPLVGCEMCGDCEEGVWNLVQVGEDEEDSPEVMVLNKKRLNSIFSRSTILTVPTSTPHSTLVIPPSHFSTDVQPTASLLFTVTTELDVFTTQLLRVVGILNASPVQSHRNEKPIEVTLRNSPEQDKAEPVPVSLFTRANPPTGSISAVLLDPFEFHIRSMRPTGMLLNFQLNLEQLSQEAELTQNQYSSFVLGHLTHQVLSKKDKYELARFPENGASVLSKIPSQSLLVAIETLQLLFTGMDQTTPVSFDTKRTHIITVSELICQFVPFDFGTAFPSPIQNALVDTLARIEWGLRPFPFAGVDVFEELAYSAQDDPELAKHPTLSFYLKHHSLPLATKRFQLNKGQNHTLSALFRCVMMNNLITFATDKPKAINFTSQLSYEQLRLKGMGLAMMILSFLASQPEDDEGTVTPFPDILDSITEKENSEQIMIAGQLLSDTVGSDPTQLFVSLLSVASLIQTEEGLSIAPITPSFFALVFELVLSTLPITFYSQCQADPLTTFALSQPHSWFHPTNSLFQADAFTRRAFLLFSSLFSADPPEKLAEFSYTLFTPLCPPSPSSSIPQYLSIHQRQYLQELQKFPVEHIPSLDSLVTLIRSFYASDPEMSSIMPSNLTYMHHRDSEDSPAPAVPVSILQPSFLSLPFNFHKLFILSRHIHCPTCLQHTSVSLRHYFSVCLVCGRSVCACQRCCTRSCLEIRLTTPREPLAQQIPVLRGRLLAEEVEHGVMCGGAVLPFMATIPFQISLSAKFRPSQLPPLYLDEFGESDIGNQRGKPLHLSLLHYSQILEYISQANSVNPTHSISYQSAYCDPHFSDFCADITLFYVSCSRTAELTNTELLYSAVLAKNLIETELNSTVLSCPFLSEDNLGMCLLYVNQSERLFLNQLQYNVSVTQADLLEIEMQFDNEA